MELLEGNLHLYMKNHHGGSEGFILSREVIELIVLTLLIFVRLGGGRFYARLKVATVIEYGKGDYLRIATCVAHHGIIMDFIKNLHINNKDFFLSAPLLNEGVPERISEGTRKNDIEVTRMEYMTTIKRLCPYTKARTTHVKTLS
ncbi:hypothetical protein M9H77_03503 [Catharanthus roseus]|uniref:Uncharacterized protein n=1 Tax=Catharanthus roseus TaxID=4058 RepID=A0ACC0CBK9_CATRO|nr:hypothetical protein M9H77_03503 [Catharanthus roseus]